MAQVRISSSGRRTALVRLAAADEVNRSLANRTLLPKASNCAHHLGIDDVSTQAALLEMIDERCADDRIGVLLISHARTLLTHWCDQVLEIGEFSQAD